MTASGQFWVLGVTLLQLIADGDDGAVAISADHVW